MADNRGIIYSGPEKVEVQGIDYPKLVGPEGRRCNHGVILKIVITGICGSDLHMLRGRTPPPRGTILGHEITGEVIEKGSDVEFIEVGDIVSVPFNVACGRCRNCKEGDTGICLNVNPKSPGGAYGYVDMGGWAGGQAEYMMIPYADFNLLKFPDKDQAMEKIKDLALLSDVLPTGFDGAVRAGVEPGSIVYISGAGPVGLACAASSQFIGAAQVIVGDYNPERLALAGKFGCDTIDISNSASLPELIEQKVGVPEVDCAVDCVGFEAHSFNDASEEDPVAVLNNLINITRAGGNLGIQGVYTPRDAKGIDNNAEKGILDVRVGASWFRSHSFHTGQTPVMKYNRQLMQAVLHDKIKIADAVNVNVITLDEAPERYKEFDRGAAKKFMIDPHGSLKKAA